MQAVLRKGAMNIRPTFRSFLARCGLDVRTDGRYVRYGRTYTGAYVRPYVRPVRMYGPYVQPYVRAFIFDTFVRAVRQKALHAMLFAVRTACRTGRTYGPYVRLGCTGLKGLRGRSRVNGRLALRVSISETVRDTSKVTIND